MRTALAALFVVAQAIQPQCSPSSGAPATPATGEVFTTLDGVRFRVATVASNLEVPWSLAFAPDGRLFVTERPGRVRIFNPSLSSSDVALTVSDVFAQDEAGVLGIAIDPDFAQNHLVYVYYSTRPGEAQVNRLVRYRESAGLLVERVVLLDNVPAGPFHNGGRIRIGPDGLIYISAGDSGVSSLAQDVASDAGKILRLNRDGTTPRDNPFGSPVFSLGHRNPQGFDWHPITGDLWSDEHGNIGNDEINVIDAGRNYGWPTIQGAQTMPGMVAPIASYSPAIAPSGASFYRGSRFSLFANNYFVATLAGTHLRRLHVDAARRITGDERLLDGRFGRLRDVVVGPDGLLYFCTNNRDGRGTPSAGDDRILRLEPES